MTALAPTILVWLDSDWETFHRPGMLRALARQAGARGGRLICVDRPMCPLTGPLRGWGNPMIGPAQGSRKWRSVMGRRLRFADPVERLDEHFYLVRDVLGFDYRIASRLPGAVAMGRRWILAQVRKRLAKLQTRDGPLVTWFHFPHWESFAGGLDEDFVVYECYDQHSAIAGNDREAARRIEDDERRLFAKSGLVFVTCSRLAELKRDWGSETHHVPNGADVEYFMRVQDPALAPDPEFAASPKPVFGYLGTLHDSLDIELLDKIAEKRPDSTLLIVGKIDQRATTETETFRRLGSRPNVRVTGWVDRERLPAILKCFDAGLIPYRQDAEFNKFVNPNKLHEYTAMGLPIVALEGVDVDSHSDQIRVAPNHDAFIEALDEAAKDHSPERIAQRLERARENSWDARTGQMMDLLMARLEKRLEEAA